MRLTIIIAFTVLCTACTAFQHNVNENHTPDTSISTWLDKPASEQALAIKQGDLSAKALVGAYLARIARIDTDVNSILVLNANALKAAEAADDAVAQGKALGLLHGLPVLLKDNIETSELPTTAGSLALINNATERDAPIVAKLKQEGAIILGKTNLSEWANFRSESSISGWSAVGGLTRNPHMLSRSACGSSSGSGAAMALRLASLAVGTETNGSVICPSSMNGVVGFKPTVGLLSRTHIVPISATQDTAGPMTANVNDAWLMTAVMAGKDENDPATLSLDSHSIALPGDSMLATDMKGVKVGVVRYRQGDDPRVLAVFESALRTLEAAGAQLVDIEQFEQPDAFWSQSYQVLLTEFHHTINEYLAKSPANLASRTLAQLIEFNKNNVRELSLFDQNIFEKSLASDAIDSTEYKTALTSIQTATREQGIDLMLSEHSVDVLVAPSNSPAFLIDGIYGDHAPGGFIGIGYLPAIAGYPHLTVPAGAIEQLPIGISFIGSKGDDEMLLRLGSIFEAKHKVNVTPSRLPTYFDRPDVKAAIQ